MEKTDSMTEKKHNKMDKDKMQEADQILTELEEDEEAVQ